MSVKTLPDGNVLVSIPPRYPTGQIIAEVFLEKVYEQGLKLQPGMTVLDVGASIGVFSLKASKIVSPAGKVIAIEPDPESFAALQENIAANNASNVIPINIAAWNNYTALEFDNTVKPTSRYVKTPEPQTIMVQAEPIDNILSEINVTHVNFVKMDIEGAAYQALQGMTNTLQNTQYVAIAAYHKRWGLNKENTENPKEIKALLTSLGFIAIIHTFYFGLVPYVYAVKNPST